jgi:hypothetical protein
MNRRIKRERGYDFGFREFNRPVPVEKYSYTNIKPLFWCFTVTRDTLVYTVYTVYSQLERFMYAFGGCTSPS